MFGELGLFLQFYSLCSYSLNNGRDGDDQPAKGSERGGGGLGGIFGGEAFR